MVGTVADLVDQVTDPTLDQVDGAERHRGVEGALVATPAGTRWRPVAIGTRQSTPTTSAPASAISPSSSPVPTPKWMRGTSRSASPSRIRRDHGST